MGQLLMCVAVCVGEQNPETGCRYKGRARAGATVAGVLVLRWKLRCVCVCFQEVSEGCFGDVFGAVVPSCNEGAVGTVIC